MATAYLIDALRSPIGKQGGMFAGLRPDDLGAQVLKALVERSGLPASAVEDVISGCVTQTSEQGMNVARIMALLAGLPVTVAGVSVNRMCGSSQQACNFAAQGVLAGAYDVVVGMGVEHMTRVAMGSDVGPPNPALLDRFDLVNQGLSAEMVVTQFQLTGRACHELSYESHRRAVAAQDQKLFEGEIVPIRVGDRRVTQDEGPRRETSVAKISGLKPAFKEDGVINAGNSSQISDGAAAVLFASESAVKKYGLKPRARVVATAVAGTDPTIMLTGPIPSTEKVLARAGLPLSAIDLFEINEAFAPVVLATEKTLGIDHAKVNVHGGAIALGHPLGCSGARLITTLLNALERRGGRYGLVTMCIGFGQGTATIIERLR